MWNSYRYTDPVAKVLTEQFGTEFALYNTGGGCICLHAVFEGNLYSKLNEPDWRDMPSTDFDAAMQWGGNR